MAADCEEAGRNLRLELRMERAARAAVAAPPSIRYEDYPTEVGKREIRISDAAARLANALHLTWTEQHSATTKGPSRPAGALRHAWISGTSRRTRRSRWRWGCRA